MQVLDEVKRRELITQAKRGTPYKTKSGTRYTNRLNCSMPSSSSAYDNIDVNKLFQDDILEARLSVIGETDTYEVIISFIGVVAELKQLIAERGADIKLSLVVRALTRAFDKNDIYLHCSCEDFKFRQSYWATIDHYNSGDPEMRPTDITNPDGDAGGVCKHCMLVLSRQVWLLKVASVITNYIKYMRLHQRKLYEKLIAPALFDMEELSKEEQEEDRRVKQMSIFDNEPEEQEPVAEEPDDAETV